MRFITCIFYWACLPAAVLYLHSCISDNKKKPDISFYYWKTIYRLSRFETDYLKKHEVKKIYLHCFDVVPEPDSAAPRGVLIWQEKPLQNINYIPTVFIRNELFLNTDTFAIKRLADNIFKLCVQIMASNNLALHEIQIDCDWTKTSRGSYFYFLTYLKQKNLIVSNTLRLYQYKYRTESGIAPTDYASLMCYNMGNMKNELAGNSILNQKDLTAYLGNLAPYPGPLNIALPIFRWTLLFNQHTFKGILYHDPKLDKENWKRISPVQYLCLQNYYDLHCEQEFYKDEIIRIEEISREELDNALQTINKHVKNSKNEIIYFDLDSSKIRRTLYE